MRRRSKKRQAKLDSAPAIRTVSDDRRAAAGQDDASFQEFVRRLPCVVCLKPTVKGDPCHRLARRRFGDWVHDLELGLIGNIYPGCRAHHGEQHDHGRTTFEVEHGIDLRVICRVVGLAYIKGWSAEGLASAARADGYERVDLEQQLDGDLPY